MPRPRNVVKRTAQRDSRTAAGDMRYGNMTTRQPLNVLEIVGNAIVGGMERSVEMLIRHLPPDRFHITCLVPFESPFTARLRRLGCDVWITPMEEDPPWRSIPFVVSGQS